MKKTQNGFTLVELLIFMGLFSVVLLVLTSLFSAIIQQQLETQGVSASEIDTTYLISRLAYDFKRADDVILPENNGDTSVVLTLDIDGEDVTYTLSNSTFQITTGAGTSALTGVGTQISDVIFTKIGNELGKPTVRAQLTVTSLAQNTTGQELSHIDTIFSIR